MAVSLKLFALLIFHYFLLHLILSSSLPSFSAILINSPALLSSIHLLLNSVTKWYDLKCKIVFSWLMYAYTALHFSKWHGSQSPFKYCYVSFLLVTCLFMNYFKTNVNFWNTKTDRKLWNSIFRKNCRWISFFWGCE